MAGFLLSLPLATARPSPLSPPSSWPPPAAPPDTFDVGPMCSDPVGPVDAPCWVGWIDGSQGLFISWTILLACVAACWCIGCCQKVPSDGDAEEGGCEDGSCYLLLARALCIHLAGTARGRHLCKCLWALIVAFSGTIIAWRVVMDPIYGPKTISIDGESEKYPVVWLPAPPLPPFTPPGGSICSNACLTVVNDGDCDDGGRGAKYSLCPYGTDCADCSAREAMPPMPPAAPSAPDGCRDLGSPFTATAVWGPLALLAFHFFLTHFVRAVSTPARPRLLKVLNLYVCPLPFLAWVCLVVYQVVEWGECPHFEDDKDDDGFNAGYSLRSGIIGVSRAVQKSRGTLVFAVWCRGVTSGSGFGGSVQL